MTCLLKFIFYYLSILGVVIAVQSFAMAQHFSIKVNSVNSNTTNELVPTNDFFVLEDVKGVLDFSEFTSPLAFDSLRVNTTHVRNFSATYWVGFYIKKTLYTEQNPIFVEFIDPHINSIRVAALSPLQIRYLSAEVGADFPFTDKSFQFKNYLFKIDFAPEADTVLVVAKIKSSSATTLLFKIRTERDFISQSKNEYLGLGIFYGLILISLITNLIIFFFVRERLYLFYIFYLLSCSLLFLSEDMLGFEYLWPAIPQFNKWVAAYAPIFLIVAFYFYAKNLIQLKNYYPKADAFIKWSILFYVLYLLVLTWRGEVTPSYHFYIIPFLAVFIFGILIARRGHKTARYFVLAHSFIIVGIFFLILRKSGVSFFNSALTFFSLHIGFAIDLAILSYALGERLNHFKNLKILAQEKVLLQLKNTQRAQRELVEQLRENQELKDKLNKELEVEVRKRAAEIVEANDKLKQQAEQINKMNRLLDIDNWALKKDILKITEERVLSKEVGFVEFSKSYPNALACLRFLSNKKWELGFKCRRCGHEHYCDGKTPLSRRCTKCRYEESPTTETLLHKCKIPIDKAFYAIFLIYSRKAEITSVELSEKLSLRQSTCWSFLQKVKTAMKHHKRVPGSGWDAVILQKE